MTDAGDLTVVLQGPLPADAPGRDALRQRIAQLRYALPGATVLISSWQGSPPDAQSGADHAVFSADPGPLPAYKLGPCKPNNVNRQIVSSAAGLAAVRTPFALKLRNDVQVVDSSALAALWAAVARWPQSRRIVTATHFSLNPRLFERLPFHHSDWFQLGRSSELLALWSCPLMSHHDATHYERQPHAIHSNVLERRFRARWPAEQWVWRHYAGRLGYQVPDFHNDTRPAVLDDHDRFLARELLLLDLRQAGLQLPALAFATRSGLQRFNCLNHIDWLAAAAREGQCRPSVVQQRSIHRRQRAQRWLQRGLHAAAPLLPWLVQPPLKIVARWALWGLDAWSRPAPADNPVPVACATGAFTTPATPPNRYVPCSTS